MFPFRPHHHHHHNYHSFSVVQLSTRPLKAMPSEQCKHGTGRERETTKHKNILYIFIIRNNILYYLYKCTHISILSDRKTTTATAMEKHATSQRTNKQASRRPTSQPNHPSIPNKTSTVSSVVIKNRIHEHTTIWASIFEISAITVMGQIDEFIWKSEQMGLSSTTKL